MKTYLTESEWKQYESEGYLILKGLLPPEQIQKLQQRIDDIMLGKADIDYDRTLMQLDSENGKYEDAGNQTKGHKGATLNYRKIQDLEWDATFLELMRHPLFEDTCRRVYGDKAIASFRAMFMNKPANRGTFLPFHQDRWTSLDRDPLLTLWVALDPATRENGCVQIVPGTHKAGLINPDHAAGFLTEEQAVEWAPENKRVFVELEPGDIALLHNHLIHGSDKNHSNQSRRAFSVCYMEAATVDTQHDGGYPVIFGDGAITACNAMRV